MRALMISIVIGCALSCISCNKPATEHPINEAVESQTEQAFGEEEMDNFSFAETITATKDDILKALQGEWSSKENGFNYSLRIDGTMMTLWYSDNEPSQTEFDIKAGMPIQIIPQIPIFNASKGRGYSTVYQISSMYYVNDRITLSIKPADKDGDLEDELVLSRGLTDDALKSLEDIKPKPNLVYNDNSPSDVRTVLKSIQGKWEGRDNCNYSVTIKDKDISIKSGSAVILTSRIHLSVNQPAHIELDRYELDSGNIQDDIFGLYYLDDSSILLSIHSGFMDNKFEYILHRPEYLGRFVLDKEVIPELEGEWQDQHGHKLTIRGNDIEYEGSKDTFHVITRSFYEKNNKIYHLISQSNERYIFGGLFMPIEYADGRLTMRMEIMDAPSPEYIFTHTKP